MKKLIVIAMALVALAAAFLLVGCSANAPVPAASSADAASASGSGDATADANAAVANPVEVVDSAAKVKEIAGVDIDIPQPDAGVQYSVIDKTLGQAVFTLDGVTYTYRIQEASEAQDISGMYYDYKSKVEGDHNGLNFVVEFNEGAQGVSVWYDGATRTTHTVAIENGATFELLNKITGLILDVEPA